MTTAWVLSLLRIRAVLPEIGVQLLQLHEGRRCCGLRERGRFVRLADRNFDQMMGGRKRAGRIGNGRISGQQERLATAASKVFGAAITGAARLLHPLFASETAEGIGFLPDPVERLTTHILK